MKIDLDGQVAIVTGAGGEGGIGQAYARALIENGARVVVADMDGGGAERVAAGLGPSAKAFRCDVVNVVSVEAMAAFAEQAFGPLGIIINNAGYMKPSDDPLLTYPQHLWQVTLDVNVTGVFNCIRAAAPRMIAHGRGGRIVNQASIGAYLPGSAYSVSKLAVIALTASFAGELGGHGITVNAIAPGAIDTPAGAAVSSDAWKAFTASTPVKPLAPTDDLVSALLFFCAPESGFVTGQTVRVDGGLTRQML